MNEEEKLIKRKQYERKSKWDDCICGNYNVHSIECKRNHLHNYYKKFYVPKNREKRHQLRKEHRCIICKKKAKRIMIYRQFCNYHFIQQSNYNKKLQLKKQREKLK